MRKLMGCLAALGLLAAWGCAHKEKTTHEAPVQAAPEESETHGNTEAPKTDGAGPETGGGQGGSGYEGNVGGVPSRDPEREQSGAREDAPYGGSGDAGMKKMDGGTGGSGGSGRSGGPAGTHADGGTQFDEQYELLYE